MWHSRRPDIATHGTGGVRPHTAGRCRRYPGAPRGDDSTPPFYAGTESASFDIDGIVPPPRGFFVAHARRRDAALLRAQGIPCSGRPVLYRTDIATSLPVHSQPVDGRAVLARTEPDWAADEATASRARALDEVAGGRRQPSSEIDHAIPGGRRVVLPLSATRRGDISDLTYVVKTPQGASILPSIRGVIAASRSRFAESSCGHRRRAVREVHGDRAPDTDLTAVRRDSASSLRALACTLARILGAAAPAELGIRAALARRGCLLRGSCVSRAPLVGAGMASGTGLSVLVRPWLQPDPVPQRSERIRRTGACRRRRADRRRHFHAGAGGACVTGGSDSGASVLNANPRRMGTSSPGQRPNRIDP